MSNVSTNGYAAGANKRIGICAVAGMLFLSACVTTSNASSYAPNSPQAKLAERITLDKAKGILMKVRGVDEAEAFALLRKQAMNSGRKIGDVAQAIIDSASLLL